MPTAAPIQASSNPEAVNKGDTSHQEYSQGMDSEHAQDVRPEKSNTDVVHDGEEQGINISEQQATDVGGQHGSEPDKDSLPQLGGDGVAL